MNRRHGSALRYLAACWCQPASRSMAWRSTDHATTMAAVVTTRRQQQGCRRLRIGMHGTMVLAALAISSTSTTLCRWQLRWRWDCSTSSSTADVGESVEAAGYPHGASERLVLVMLQLLISSRGPILRNGPISGTGPVHLGPPCGLYTGVPEPTSEGD